MLPSSPHAIDREVVRQMTAPHGRIRPTDLALIFLSAAFQTASIAFGKQASLSLAGFAPKYILTNAYYLISLLFLAMQAVTWQLALVRAPLSYAYSLMSIVYVNVLLLSAFMFHETVSLQHVAGAALIMSGIALMARGKTSYAGI